MVEALDQAGNVSTPASYTWNVDTTLPTVSIKNHPGPFTNSTSASFTFMGNDTLTPTNLLTYLTSINGSAFVTNSSPATYSGLAPGNNTFQVESMDQAGNVSLPASFSWLIDTTPPATSTVATLPTSSTATVAVSWSGSDGVGGSGVASYTIYVSDKWRALSLRG